MKPRYEDVRARLRFVGRSRDDYDLSLFPDFLIVGPQRTGTTWLFENLSSHPDVFMPAEKELQYFSSLGRSGQAPPPAVDPDLGAYLDRFRVPRPQRRRLDAQSRARFGRPFTGRVRGEATATYAAALREEVIGEILTLNPDVKVVVMVRDPVERAWSHAKKDLAQERHRAVREVTEAEWLEFVARPYQQRCARYSEFLPRWRALVPAANLLVGRFVDVQARPRELLADVCRLLGVEADERFMARCAGDRINRTEPARMPEVVRRRLEEMFADEVGWLRQEGLIPPP